MSAALKLPEADTESALQATVGRDALSAAMRQAIDVVERKGAIPILSHVRLTASGEGLTLQACDTYRNITVTIPADVSAPGDLCLPGQALRSLVDGWPKGAQVAIKANEDGKQCAVASGRSRYKLSALDPASFPEITPKDGAAFSLPGSVLASIIGRISFAVSDEQTRHYLRGIYCHAAGDKLIFAATTGTVLARLDLERPAGLDAFEGIIIPDVALPILARLADGAEAVQLVVSASTLSAQAGGVSFLTRLVDGTFPDYQRVIPEPSPERSAMVSRADMLSALARLGSIEDSQRIVRLRPSDSGLEVSGAHSASGEGLEHVEAKTAGDFVCALPRQQLVNSMQAFTGEHVRLEQGAPGCPVRLSGTGDDAGLTVVIMPMRG